MSGAFGGIRDADVAGAGLCTGGCSSAAAPCRCGGRGLVLQGAGGWFRGGGCGRGGRGGTVSGSVCGAALPVIFWRSSGRAAGLTLGGVVLTGNGDRDEVERQLAGGELACS